MTVTKLKMYARRVFLVLWLSSPAVLSRNVTEKDLSCGSKGWQCKDGSCITNADRCNGVVDCPDASDETKNTCLDNVCTSSQFRCLYGGCVEQSAGCDGVVDCADSSDEIMARCYNKTFDEHEVLFDMDAANPRLKRQADYCRLHKTSHTFMGKCIQIYNKLPLYVTELPLHKFKLNVKEILMKKAYYKVQQYLDDKNVWTHVNVLDPPINNLTAPSAIDFCKRRFKCKNGVWISSYDKCDGIPHCPDGSDETFILCRNQNCQPNWFRCMYGACVDGAAPCNGKQECADNSDELLPRCRNEKEVTRNFTCDDGSAIPAQLHCDGDPDCKDGSDETLRTCAGKRCAPYLFQCAYGACVDQGSDCNNNRDCVDNSDELEELCNNTMIVPTFPPPPPKDEPCVLPPQPIHGSYIVENMPNAYPGQTFNSVVLGITCQPPYGINGLNWTICDRGHWYPEADVENICVPQCQLPSRESAIYRCISSSGGTRDCEDTEPLNTVVVPVCKPNYELTDGYNDMVCLETGWSTDNPCKIVASGTIGNNCTQTTEDPEYDIDIRHENTNKLANGSSASDLKKRVDKKAELKLPVTSRL